MMLNRPTCFTFLFLCMVSQGVAVGQEYRVVPTTPLPPVRIDTTTSTGATYAQPFNVVRSLRGRTWYGGGAPNMELVDFLASQYNQQQIEFSADQKKMLTDFQKKLSTEYTNIANQFPRLKEKDLSREERQKLNQTVYLEYQKVKKKMSKELEGSLVPQQVKLVKQLRFNQTAQMYGLTWAITNAPFKEDIDLSDKQKDEVNQIKMESEKAIQKKLAEMREEAKEKMLKVLNKKQRDKLKELQGEKKGAGVIRL